MNILSPAKNIMFSDHLDEGIRPAESGERADTRPFVSVIVTVKDEAATIKGCLNSLLDLDYEAYEILVIDTGSADNTLEIVKGMGLEHQRIRWFTTSGNASQGRNLGVSEAKGSLLAFTDGDCVVTKNWLRTLVHSLLTNCRSTVGVGGPNVPVFVMKTRWSTAADAVLNTFLGSGGSAQVKSANSLYVRSISTANSVFWAESIRKIGSFDLRLDLCEDADLCSRLTKTGSRLRFEEKAIVFHRRDYQNPWKFGRHMFKYGKWRGRALVLKPRTNISWTALAMLGSVASVVLLLALSLLGSVPAESTFLVLTVLYLFALVIQAIKVSRNALGIFLAMLPTFLILHASYTTGLLTGIFSMVRGLQRK